MKRWRSYSADQWREWLAAQPQSGQTVEAFCRSTGISTQSFYRWRSKLAATQSTDSKAASPDFIPLTVVGSDRIEITLPCGATIHAPHEESALRRLLGILMQFSPPC